MIVVAIVVSLFIGFLVGTVFSSVPTTNDAITHDYVKKMLAEVEKQKANLAEIKDLLGKR